jgi:very-short-patch-repair endonuclease
MVSKIENARRMRKAQTPAEAKLWFHLRNRNMRGLKFRRQVPVGRYMADFLCESAMLIVEVDGAQHAERMAEDAVRTAALESMGYHVVRIWNADVMSNVTGVLDGIWHTLELCGATDAQLSKD